MLFLTCRFTFLSLNNLFRETLNKSKRTALSLEFRLFRREKNMQNSVSIQFVKHKRNRNFLRLIAKQKVNELCLDETENGQSSVSKYFAKQK
jgi:hypothetical protein